MLTPAQIRAHRFISAVRGSYKAEDVDIFFDEVLSSYEQAFKENAELIKKITLLAERVEAYRNDEDNIKVTLLTAQRMADQMTREAIETSQIQLKSASEKLEYAESHAKAQAQLIIDDANKKAQEELENARAQARLVITDAEKSAAEILDTAKKESAEQLAYIKDELTHETSSLEGLKREAAAFKGELIEKYRQHIEFIGCIPGTVGSILQNDFETSVFEKDSGAAITAADTEDETQITETKEENPIIETVPFAESQETLPVIESEDDFNADETTSPLQINLTDDDIAIDATEGFIEKFDEFDTANNEKPSLSNDDDGFAKVFETDVEDAADYLFEGTASGNLDELTDDDSNADAKMPEEPVNFFGFSADENKDEGEFPSLFTLRQRAMAQQQELSGTDIYSDEEVMNSKTADIDSFTAGGADSSESIAPEFDEEDEFPPISAENSGGFKVFIENLDDEEALDPDVSEDNQDSQSTFETVEYDDDDDDDDDDDNGDSQPRFKGFFKK